MKKYIAFSICLMMLISLFSCRENSSDPFIESNEYTENTSESEEMETTTLSIEEETTAALVDAVKNEIARQAFGAVIRNEYMMYYHLLDAPSPSKIYFKNIAIYQNDPARQATVDFDQDGINELILSYGSKLIILHFENDVVYGTAIESEAMETIYTDGSFSWNNYSEEFGFEYGVSRLSFVNGKFKYQELYRTDGSSKFYINGAKVTEKQYMDHIEKNHTSLIKFTDFDISFLNSDEVKAINIASEHWKIKDGDFDSETGYRYRITCVGKMGDLYRISLYRFVNNSYYQHLEIASVDVVTGEISTSKYPDGKG